MALSREARVWAIAGVAFVGGVGGGVVFPILPVVGAALGISGVMIGLILSMNRITRLAMNPATGTLIDRFGARMPVAVGLALETVGTLAYVVALDSHLPTVWFLLGRAIWGIGSSGVLVGALAAALALSDDRSRGRTTARVRTAISIGFPAGLVIGGLVADLVSDAAAFWVATGLTFGVGLLALVVMPDHGERRADRPPPPRGREAWTTVLALPTLRIIFAANALLFFSLSGVLLATIALMVDSRGLSVFGMGVQGSAGLLMAVLTAARASASLLIGRHLDRRRGRTGLLLPAMAAVAAGFMILGLAAHTPVAVVGLVLAGAGAGGLTIPMLTLLGDVAPADLHGRALSVYQWSSDIGGALGPMLGLSVGRWLGFGPTYALVGLAVLMMALPLRRLVASEQAGGRR
ncbi:MFS transporter [Salinisphaera sp. Q1T1-3]|uniref:MFS transporter n=1 Tax=Salinisphaera sp. Q1T1-3 TaxID=2321229 RepID=UPI000E76C0A4|nr:MFS transporter [Salinisphaera sp. Q1T1-3]RJS93493.1 MFS transporter [Salinisphaera sp. Q1T1-3]